VAKHLTAIALMFYGCGVLLAQILMSVQKVYKPVISNHFVETLKDHLHALVITFLLLYIISHVVLYQYNRGILRGLSFRPSVDLSVCLSAWLSVCLSVCLSAVCLSACLSLCGKTVYWIRMPFGVVIWVG